MRFHIFILLATAGFVIPLSVIPQSAFAQTSADTSEQVTLSEDLANNPVAQDILKKIEQTKQWIKDLEEKNYDALEAKKQLDAKRVEALEKLNQDLKDWEALWDYYSPKNSFSRFVNTVQEPQVQQVFWDQFEFHQIKVDAGKKTLKEVIARGGFSK